MERLIVDIAPFLDPETLAVACDLVIPTDDSDRWRTVLLNKPFECTREMALGAPDPRKLCMQMSRASVELEYHQHNLNKPLDVLRDFPGAKGVVVQAIERLTDLYEHHCCRERARQEGVHLAVHQVLKAFPMDREVQIAGLYSLVIIFRPLGSPAGSVVRRLELPSWCGETIVGDVAVDAMKNHADVPEVVCNAIWAASNIALLSEQHQWLMENNINNLIMDTMERYIDNQLLQLRGLSTLINTLDRESDLTRAANIACIAHELHGKSDVLIVERSVWVLAIIAHWQPHLLRNERVRQCANYALQHSLSGSLASRFATVVMEKVFIE